MIIVTLGEIRYFTLADPNSFIFMQFSPKNRLAHLPWELAPPQENPGSATVIMVIVTLGHHNDHCHTMGKSTGKCIFVAHSEQHIKFPENLSVMSLSHSL